MAGSQYRIYLIRSEGRFYKVGYSHDVKNRIALLQSGNPHEISVLHQSDPINSSSLAYKIERRLHRELENYHVRGEWFEIPPESVLDVVGLVQSVVHVLCVEDFYES